MENVRAGDLVSARVKPVQARRLVTGLRSVTRFCETSNWNSDRQPGHEGKIGDVVAVDVEVRRDW